MTTYYTSPTGLSSGDGSQGKPWDIVTALGKTLSPGDVLTLLSGTYVPTPTTNSRLQVLLAGTVNSPVTIQAQGRATIDLKNFAGFEIQGSYTRWFDIELYNSIIKSRITSQTGSWSAETDRGGISVNGSGVEMIDCVIHNFNNGVFCGLSAVGGLYYGCIFYNHGWQGGDRNHGHHVYLQNTGVKPKVCEMCMGFGAYDDGYNAYGTVDSQIKGIQFKDNFGSHNGKRNMQFGGETPLQDAVISGNAFGLPAYMPADTLAVTGGSQYVGPSVSLLMENNYIVGALRTSGQSVKNMTCRNNTFINGRDSRFVDWIKTSTDVINWDSNFYFGTGMFLSNGISKTFAQWQADGYDATSPIPATSIPNKYILKPHRYKTGKAHLAVFNWSRSPSAVIDLAPVVQVGKNYEIRSMFDPYGSPVLSGTYSGPVTLPLGTVTPPKPIGATNSVAIADNRFNFFIVTSDSTVPPVINPPVIQTPVDGTTLIVGQTYTATGSASGKWHVDISGAANPPDTVGIECIFTVPINTTRIIITLTNTDGQDTNTYPVSASAPTTKKRAVLRDDATGKEYVQLDDGSFQEIKRIVQGIP